MLSPATSAPTNRASFASPMIDDFEKGTRGGTNPPAKEALEFGDLLDAINPLQHIPGVSTLYRSLTGDTIKPIAKVAGGLLYGGPAGAITAGVMAAIEEIASNPVSDSASPEAAIAASPTSPAIVARAEPIVLAAAIPERATAPDVAAMPASSARTAAAPQAPTPRQLPPAPQAATTVAPATAASSAANTDASRGKDIRSYIAESMPARRTAPAVAAAAPTTNVPAAVPTKSAERPAPVAKPAADLPDTATPAASADFAGKMLQGLEKYRAVGGLRPTGTVDQNG